jgi:syntaxin 1B/2/3|uniref:Syntaxin N-terminal domain-containing protein n=1 Tax=Zea mays TaxID=4577 RepID=A0A804P7G4_MAIZE
MNSLFSSSWKRGVGDGGEQGTSSPAAWRCLRRRVPERGRASTGSDVDVTRTGPGTLTVESIKEELRDLERIQRSLHDANVGGKSLHDAAAVRGLRARMDADVGTTIKKAKVVKLRLESLDRANAANRSVPGCGHGSSTDRTRTSVVAGLRKKLRDSMESFSSLRSRSCTSTGTRWRGATSR